MRTIETEQAWSTRPSQSGATERPTEVGATNQGTFGPLILHAIIPHHYQESVP